MSGCGTCGGHGLDCKENQKMLAVTGFTIFSLFTSLPGKVKAGILVASAGIVGILAYNKYFTLIQEEENHDSHANFNICENEECEAFGEVILNKGSSKIISEEGNNTFGFSLCTSKEPTIIGFDASKDNIYIFCSKQTISKGDIRVETCSSSECVKLVITKNSGEKMTITLDGKHKIDEIMKATHLNEKGPFDPHYHHDHNHEEMDSNNLEYFDNIQDDIELAGESDFPGEGL